MKSSYKPISELVERIDIRNSDGNAAILMGLSIDKCFIRSVANTVGTDLTKYKVICKNQFAVSLMQVSRDSKIPVACFRECDRAIMSPAYSIFQVADESVVLPDYLDMWFKRPEFDREAAFIAVGGVRGSMPWDEFARIKVCVPSLERQKEIVDAYKAVDERIHIKQQINDNLFATVNAFFTENFSRFLHEDMRNMPNYVQLKNFIKIKHGYAFDGEQFSETKTSKILVSPGNFKIGGGFQNNKPKFYNETAEYKTDYVLEPRSLVVTMTDLSKNGDTLGFPAIIPNDKQLTFLHNQRVGLVELVNNIYPKAFIYFLMCSNDYRNYILATASGTTVRHTSPDKILGYGFLAPDNKSDLMLLNRLYEAYLSDCDTLNIEIQRLTELQNTLLSKMVC